MLSEPTPSTLNGTARACPRTVVGEVVWRGGIDAGEPLGRFGPPHSFELFGVSERHAWLRNTNLARTFMNSGGWKAMHIWATGRGTFSKPC